VTATDTPTLSARLRAETRDAHLRAERSGIMRRVLRAEIDVGDYLALLDELALVYGALEDGLERQRAHRLVAPFAFARLRRLPALQADRHTLGATIMRCRGTTEAARTLATRIHDASRSDPARLVAHAYVRYLGDLSGGQILRGLVSRALDLHDGTGTAFHDFAPHEPETLKRDFRSALDALPLSAEEADAMVDEARRAFALHESLFEELDTPKGTATLDLLDLHGGVGVTRSRGARGDIAHREHLLRVLRGSV